MAHPLALAALDWVVMAVYGLLVLGIGIVATLRQKSTEDYFLGGRRLRWWAVGVSLIATSFSAVSLIGGTGFGFSMRGMRWLQLQIGDLVGLVVVCLLFLPFFSRLRLTTAYEYLELRFGVGARCVASALFLGQTILRASVLLLPPALALATILDWRVETAIVVTAAVAIVYSAFGGIGAVVWTDLLQMAVVLFSVAYCLWLVLGDVPGGLAKVLDHSAVTGQLEVVTIRADRRDLFNLLGALVPYTVFAISIFGTNQQAVQRYMSCRDLESARRAALLSWTIGTVALGLTLFLGVCLSAWVELVPDAALLSGDSVLPGFIEARLPAGVAGLALAAIFAASMSSLDSAVHSTSTAWIVDFWRRFSKGEPDPRRELVVARITTVVFGVLATVGALYAARRTGGILQTLVDWLGLFAGPLLGLFLLGMLVRRATERGALVGVFSAFAWVAAAVLLEGGRPGGFAAIWLAPFSCAVTVLVGWAASFLWPAPAAGRLEGLALKSGGGGGVSA